MQNHQEMAPSLIDIIFIILQYMYKYNMYESAQNLEQESKLYFNLGTFADMIRSGLWENVHKYLRSFLDPSDSYNSMIIFWKIGRAKYLEALDKKDFIKALSVFEKDLKPLTLACHRCTRQLTELIPLENFREKHEYAHYGDTETMRAQLAVEVVVLLKHHPLIHYRLFFPKIDESRLETLLWQSAEWQHLIRHHLAANPAANSTLFAGLPSFNPHRSADSQLILRDPSRTYQNHGAGPSSSAPHLDDLNVNPSVFRRP